MDTKITTYGTKPLWQRILQRKTGYLVIGLKDSRNKERATVTLR